MALFDNTPLYQFDTAIEQASSSHVVGLDEAGRGPLAGPVIAAAVILDLKKPIPGIFDSKKVSPKKREELFNHITSQAASWAIGEASPVEIDEYNILQASLLAMKRALYSLHCAWSLALIDGNQYIPSLARSLQKTVVKGDALSASIAAASILAKVTRDRIMTNYHELYPGWDFNVHKGYPTARHRAVIGKIGICDIHRKSFCTRFVEQPLPRKRIASNGTH